MSQFIEYEGTLHLDKTLSPAFAHYLQAFFNTAHYPRSLTDIDNLIRTQLLDRSTMLPDHISNFGADGKFFAEPSPAANDLPECSRTKPADDCPDIYSFFQYHADDNSITIHDSSLTISTNIDWLNWLITYLLEPVGCKLNGTVHYYGDDEEGLIFVKDNKVTTPKLNLFDDICIPEIYANAIIDQFGIERQPMILIEEMSELTKELSKNSRGKENKAQLIEEMAHVLLSIGINMQLFGITAADIQSEIDKKQKQYPCTE